MTKARLSIHQAAAALLKELRAPQGAVATMVDIDEKKGDVIRVLVAPEYRSVIKSIPTSFGGYPVLVGRQPPVFAFATRR